MNLAELRYAVNNPPEGRSLMDAYEDVSAYAEALEAEVERLAALLSDVIEHYDSDDSEGYYRPLDDAVEAARAALAAEKGET